MDVVDGLGQGLGELARTFAVAFQQMEGHALGGLGTHAGQAAEGLDQLLNKCARDVRQG